MCFIIISCFIRGCVSFVRFMVFSSRIIVWIVGKLVLCSCSECIDSIVGMLRGIEISGIVFGELRVGEEVRT